MRVEIQKNYYLKNREKYKNYNKNYYLKNREKIRLNHKEYYINGGKEILIAYQKKNRDKINMMARERNKKVKLIILKHYGEICKCCNEGNIEFLTLYHINGGGQKQRKKLGGKNDASTLYRWLIKNNFPDGYQILCFNCNISKGIYGYCPHKYQDKSI